MERQDHMLASQTTVSEDAKSLPSPCVMTTTPLSSSPSSTLPKPRSSGHQGSSLPRLSLRSSSSSSRSDNSKSNGNNSSASTSTSSNRSCDPPRLPRLPDIPAIDLAPIASSSDGRTSLSPIGNLSHADTNNVLPPIAALTQSLEPVHLRASSRASTHSASPSLQLQLQHRQNHYSNHQQHQHHHQQIQQHQHQHQHQPQQQQPQQRRPSPPRLTSWPTGNPLTSYYQPSHDQPVASPAKMDVEMSITPRSSSVSLDDPDVRMAAEALGDLRADFVSTPKQQTGRQSQMRAQPEPLLQLLTTSHPLLAKTIEGTTTVYNTSKNYSPRFKSGAEYVEGYLTPIGNTLGSVGRVTGVEGGVRWFLKGSARRQPSSSDLESGEGSRSKRRKMQPAGDEDMKMSDDADRMGIMSPPPHPMGPPEFDPFAYRSSERRMSISTVDSLPAYDDARSPAYTENAGEQGSPTAQSPAWQSRLIMSTSGLSIAMSEESLRSLKYCLQWLRWANDRIANVIGALKVTLEQFERHPETGETTSRTVTIEIPIIAGDEGARSEGRQDGKSNEELGKHVAALKSDLLKTLRAVIDTVSKYAGGALPENARVLVKRHLTSLPQRFKLASQADQSAASSSYGSGNGNRNGDKEVREGAQRVLVLAQEGLDMMAQVSGVLDGTIVSAEEWCARLGKKKHDERAALTNAQSSQHAPLEPMTSIGVDGDVKMG